MPDHCKRSKRAEYPEIEGSTFQTADKLLALLINKKAMNCDFRRTGTACAAEIIPLQALFGREKGFCRPEEM